MEEIVPGELTIVTGVPNSGKSEWIDALLCNLNRSAGWKFALCSMENNVCLYGRSVERMSLEELEVGKQWLSDTFHLIRTEREYLQQWNGGPPNLYDISGSAHFINKCDNGIVIHRNRDPKAGALDLVQVLCFS
ncbi:hypothetical protein L1987_83390 [Smallanthus sonchifolius]|uniref:Uncharacterized protein n=1 Tax=Smallanthus sonchifolius TaxID=185202 RepID=A0ACB8YD63_9ASTR|nr:hypothetical protein L1987_83390 [Smallanthus sonchifolius]